MSLLRVYGDDWKVTFPLYNTGGLAFTGGLTFVTGDALVSTNAGSLANSVYLPGEVGSGLYFINIDGATESNGQYLDILIADQSSPKLWMDTRIHVDMYGNVNAVHEFNLDNHHTGTRAANVVSILGSTTTVEKQQKSINAMATGSFTGEITNTSALTDLPSISSGAYQDRLIVFTDSGTAPKRFVAFVEDYLNDVNNPKRLIFNDTASSAGSGAEIMIV